MKGPESNFRRAAFVALGVTVAGLAVPTGALRLITEEVKAGWEELMADPNNPKEIAKRAKSGDAVAMDALLDIIDEAMRGRGVEEEFSSALEKAVEVVGLTAIEYEMMLSAYSVRDLAPAMTDPRALELQIEATYSLRKASISYAGYPEPEEDDVRDWIAAGMSNALLFMAAQKNPYDPMFLQISGMNPLKLRNFAQTVAKAMEEFGFYANEEGGTEAKAAFLREVYKNEPAQD